ncbi:hypothetical protein N9C85_01610 [Synechococcus sp. AH-224-I15]|nr:hypothetical protein [Synechococcus sp. AH-224-I15]
MKVNSFVGSDGAMRRYALKQAIPEGIHALDIGRFDMSNPWGRQHGATAVATGPLVGDRRVVVWENAGALSKLSPTDPTWTLLMRVAARPRPDVTLLAEGESISIPVDGWSALITRGSEHAFNTPSMYRPEDQIKLVETIAQQVGVDLVDGAAEAVLEACGTDSAGIRHLLERLQLSHAPTEDELEDLEAAAYEAKRADWAGFHECQVVRTDDGRTGVITVLGIQGCGLIQVNLEARQLLGHIFDANTPDRLTPLEVAPAMAKEIKTLVKKVHAKTGSVHRSEDLLAEHLPAWTKGPKRKERHPEPRNPLAFKVAIAPAMVRASASPEALSVFDLVDAALNGNKPRALRAAAAVANSKAKVGEILRVIQKQSLQQLVLTETLNADKAQVAKILGYRKSGVVYFRRKELPLLCQPEAVLATAIAMANEVTEGLRPTPRQVVQRFLISAFGSA